MVTILIPLLVAVIGCLVYALSANAKLVEIGRLLFFAGALVSLLALQGHAVHLP